MGRSGHCCGWSPSGWLVGRLTGRSLGVLVVNEGPEHFAPLAELCVSGEVEVHIDRTFPLEQTAAALAHVGEGRALGKVVVLAVEEVALATVAKPRK